MQQYIKVFNPVTMKMDRKINPFLIALSGRKESGKSVLANVLQNIGYVRVSFATPLKQLIANLLKQDINFVNEHKLGGIEYKPTQTDIEYISNETSIAINDVNTVLSGITFTNTRDMLQIIGTDLIRKFDNNWHVKKTKEYIESLPEGTKIVIDDLRFPNEKNMVDEMYGESWYIVRPKYNNVSNHISETSLKWQDFGDHVIINDKSKEELESLWINNINSGYEFFLDRRNAKIRHLHNFKNDIKDTKFYQHLMLHKDWFEYTPYNFDKENSYLKVEDNGNELSIYIKNSDKKFFSPSKVNILMAEDLKIYL